MNEQNNKGSGKILIVVFLVVLVVFGIVFGKDLANKYHKSTENSAVQTNENSEFNNIESEIFQVKPAGHAQEKTSEASINQTEILLRQQLQISELQNNFHELKSEIDRVKTGDALSKIILSFIKLQDLVDQKHDYTTELQKLELLCRADFALSRKVEKLKIALETPSKNNLELSKEFAKISPILKAKKVEIDSHGSWIGKLKSFFTKFIVIKKTGEKSKTEFEVSLNDLQVNIENRQYVSALTNIENIGPEYQEILAGLKTDLQNTNDFKKISDEIYRYLEMLSN